MRVMRGLAIGVMVAAVWGSGNVLGQTRVTSRVFTGLAAVMVTRPGMGVTRQQVGVEAVFSPYRARLTVTPPGGDVIPVDYAFLEVAGAGASLAILFRGSGGTDSVLPGLLIARARPGLTGTSLLGMGMLSGTDALGSFGGLLVLQLQQVVAVDPTPPPPPSPPPPTPTPSSTLPAFDGITLRVASQWGVRKFEGFALRLASKYGTLPGGTTATVPASWAAGVMQCHGAEGFVYELPLTLSYQGFVNGMILYTPEGTFPSWEDPARWHPIAAAGGYTKHVYR